MSPLMSWLLVLLIIGLPALIGVLVERRRREDARVEAFFAALRSEVSDGYDEDSWTWDRGGAA